ncbi:uncharacterized protein LOC142332786 [Lycorma delicatula]|uniref:uncharacterized protein LOC142332786 n=1 Tax=Lycorma delicatula TaxID=130591 RepID=UPI003F516DC4
MSSDQDESSSTSQSVSDQEERPMKKARYIWQIKGRYRFRQGRHRTCSEDCNCSNSGGSSSLVVMRPDWPVHRWQTRQMAKAVVDNTINKVIEDMGIVPLDHDTDGFLDEAYETFQSPRNPANLEDAAVMMAIQSHGLQQKKCSCQNLPSESNAVIQRTPFHHRPPYSSIQQEATSSNNVDGNVETTQQPHFEHDFLAQAVAVAIQKKGLNAFNTDHG